jgi:hypothetical protein
VRKTDEKRSRDIGKLRHNRRSRPGCRTLFHSSILNLRRVLSIGRNGVRRGEFENVVWTSLGAEAAAGAISLPTPLR